MKDTFKKHLKAFLKRPKRVINLKRKTELTLTVSKYEDFKVDNEIFVESIVDKVVVRNSTEQGILLDNYRHRLTLYEVLPNFDKVRIVVENAIQEAVYIVYKEEENNLIYDVLYIEV